jgi:hypothetical protein
VGDKEFSKLHTVHYDALLLWSVKKALRQLREEKFFGEF